MQRSTLGTIAIVAVIAIVIIVVVALMGPSGNNDQPSGENEVRIASGYTLGFSPNSLTIQVNENVTWINNSGTDHDIVSDNDTVPFDSGVLANGQTYTHRFEQVGVFPYHCSIHPTMTGTITVIA
jgi:plastocyanin